MVDMLGPGTGGLISGLLNPDLTRRVAQHITPNPNPLAQQGGAGGVDSLGNPVGQPPPGANLPPGAATQPDPVNAGNISKLIQPDPSYAMDMMRYQRMGQLSEDLNQNLQGVAASFGTAQQQASKQAALRGGGGVGDNLGDLAKIQGMQQATIDQSEHARFMGNAAVFAQTLSQATGQPISVQQATEIMNNPDLLSKANAAIGANMATTTDMKNAEAATQEMAKAHPEWTPQDRADYKASILSTMVGNFDPAQREMMQASRAWDAANKGAPPGSKPAYLTDITQWKAHGDVIANAQKDLTEAKNNFGAADSKAAAIEATLSKLVDENGNATAATIAAIRDSTLRTEGPGARYLPKALGGEDQSVVDARAQLNTLMNELSAQGMQGFSRLPLGEFSRMAAAATNLSQQGLSPEAINAEFQRLVPNATRARANIQAQAGKTLDAQHAPYADTQYFDPTDPFYSHATLSPEATKAGLKPGTAGLSGQSSGQPSATSAPKHPDGVPSDRPMQYDPDTGRWRDPATGQMWDKNGKPL